MVFKHLLFFAAFLEIITRNLIHSFLPQPGDCLVFHMKTLHGISSAMSDTPRYVIATRWVGEDVVLATRPWSTSPPPEILPTDLKIGERFCESKGFPTIWKKPGN